MFKLQRGNSLSVTVKGWLASPIQYEVRCPTANWSPFFGHYENQKWGGFDTNSCWCLAPVNTIEDDMEWLDKNGIFSPEAKKFFIDNGYVDADGDYSLSERFLEIKGGNYQRGGTPEQAFQLMQEWGCLPRSMLTFTDVASYFNPSAITPEMEALAQQFKKYVNIAYQQIGKGWITPSREILIAALKQAPLCIGIPVPTNVNDWNNSFVQWDGNKTLAHEVELYGIDDKGQYLVFDQYEPHLKTLSADYPLMKVTQGIVYAVQPASVNPIVQPADNSTWTWIFNWINNALKPFRFA